MSLRGVVMVDVTLEIERVPGLVKWRVALQSPVGRDSVYLDPVTDADLREVEALPVDSWQGLVALLRPGGGLDAQHLRLLGELIMRRLLEEPKLRAHLQRLDERQRQRREPLRFLLDILDDGDALLADLPLELLHDGGAFVFRRVDRPALRCVPSAPARNLRLERGAQVLLVTAHADEPPHPNQAELAAHAEALQRALVAAGYAPRWLEEATKEGLRQALLAEPVAVLYVACHGLENHREAGALLLRDGPLSGLTLKEWLLAAEVQHQRPVQVVLLCACSSAVPQAERGTSGMAQWLVQSGGALAALGYRGPVAVAWALQFSERLFRYLGEGRALEDAFARARCDAEVSDPQWVLPLLYGSPQDLNELLTLESGTRSLHVNLSSRGEGELRSILPRAPRAFFTGRVEARAALGRWLQQPGTAQLSGLEGGGGIGKTELACYVAHEQRAANWPVLFLESPERDLRGAVAKLIQAAQPSFELKPEHTQEELGQRLREVLAPHRGLLVLDDVSDDRAVQALLPGGGWNVLFTSRAQGLVPGATVIGVRPMESAEAQELFCRVAYGQATPPLDEGAAVVELVGRLGGVPLALELSAAALRREGLGAAEYLAQLQEGAGAAAEAQGEVQRVLLRSLAKLPVEDGRVFCGLGILPAAGAALREVAVAVGESEPQVLRRLARLQRYHLVEVTQEGVYGLHPLLREAARAKAKQAGCWDGLHQGGAAAMEGLAGWVEGDVRSRVDQRLARWLQVQAQFDSLDMGGWLEGAPGGAAVAMVLAFADQYRSIYWPPSKRAPQLTMAMTLLPDRELGWRRANVLFAQGNLRQQNGDLEGANQDLDSALALHLSTQNLQGQANVLRERGEVRRKRGDILGASEDILTAHRLYLVLGDSLGQSITLRVRGALRSEQGDLTGADEDYQAALQLALGNADPVGQANILTARGFQALAREDGVEAERCFRAAIHLFEAVDFPLGLAQTNLALALAMILLNQPDQAKQCVQQAIHWAVVSEGKSVHRVAEELLTRINNELLARSPAPPATPGSENPP